MNIRIEKRVPFGFKGKWGKCYKLTNFNNGSPIIYQDNTYYDIGYDVQFKYLENGIDKTTSNSTPIANLVTKGEFRLVKTTDAYFNIDTNEYECVVQPNDLVKVFGDWWVCEKIEDKSIYTPKKQTFYYLSLKKVFDKVVEDLEYENINATIIEVFNKQQIDFNVYDNQEVLIDWGDGVKETITSSKYLRHAYIIPTSTTIKIFSNSSYKLQIEGINNITNLKLDDKVVGGRFAGCSIYKFEFSTGITRLTTQMFSGIKRLNKIIIPSEITYFESSVFNNCEDLEYVEIKANVTGLGTNTFTNCSKLRYVLFNDNIQSIGAYCFSECISLQHIVLPGSITGIGVGAFENCPLKTMELKSITPPSLYSNGGITQDIEVIYIPYGTLNAYQTAWSNYADKFVEK